MIFHVSIAAGEPQRVAEVIAELWRGAALPVPPVADGAWIAMAGDARNSAIEIYRFGSVLVPADDDDGDRDARTVKDPVPSARTATHVAIATDLGADQVHAIGRREGWLTRYRMRGALFGVIEFWLENAVMIEVLTPSMQREYLSGVSIEQWRDMVAASPEQADPE
ncbi:hypothetical protein [Sandarakinorhabdus sp. DWP1-3-1]|uniref:hypothetical protein n=1 Tax=Sandarakinorhabdus sp. DWP1-3-1 TaxID=2804627 RepID=UPI003CF7B724